jgi:epoxyqueuosine reductase
MEKSRLTALLKAEARQLGFNGIGVCPAIQPPGLSRFRAWLEAGYAGQMRFLAEREPLYEHPAHVLNGVRSIIMMSLNYRTLNPRATGPGQGRVSQYAWGDADYHDVIRERLSRLREVLTKQVPAAKARGVVDTAPLLEHEFARLAGLGWIGKNTLLLNQQSGSWFFLAALLTDVELTYDEPFAADHCGTCTACLDACPTNALPRPYVLDARRCISYLTIELRDAVPADLRDAVDQWLFGCDICQDVCPWNRRAPPSDEPAFAPRDDANPVELIPLFELSDDQFRRRFRHTPLWRAKRRGILRNAAIVLGNHPTPLATDALIRGLGDAEPLVRGASAWALGRYDQTKARRALETRLPLETDDAVRGEIAAALTNRRTANEGKPRTSGE